MQRRTFLTTLAALTLASQTLLSANAYSAENTPAPEGKIQGGMWADFAVNDGHLITGQQQHSGRSVAPLVMQQLAK